MRKRLTIIVASIAMLIPLPAGAQSPDGQIGVRLLDAPVGRKDDPRARLYIVDHLAPGTTIDRRIEVTSGLDDTTRVSLYAAGAEIRDGTFTFFDARRQNDVSSWTRVEPSVVSIDPGGAAQATVTITVPRDASGGERYAVVWAEIASGSDGAVRAVNRVGIRIYLSVGGGAEPASDFVVDTLTASRTAAGAPQVSAMVRNTGERALDMSGELQLENGPGGLRAGPFEVKLGTTLAIGASAPVIATLDPAIPLGPWDARIVLRSGELVREAKGRITFPSAPGTSNPPVKAVMDTGWGRAMVATAAALILVIGGVLVVTIKRRRRRASSQAPETKAPARAGS